MKHIFLINSLDQLNVKKDSSLFWALSLQSQGFSCYLLFENDYYYDNSKALEFKLFSFEGKINDQFYIENFNLTGETNSELVANDTLHFRIDPPVDEKYITFLWLASTLKKQGIKVVNDPNGILQFNEKIIAFELENKIPTIITDDASKIKAFASQFKQDDFIIKPLNSFSGFGVKKFNLSELSGEIIQNMLKEGAKIVQPFMYEITKGEIRSVFYQQKHLGSILKTPVQGEYLANIAQGARFKAIEISQDLLDQCLKVCQELNSWGIDLIAFDILEGKISEVNITCPGLLVEVSSALKKNIALDIGSNFHP